MAQASCNPFSPRAAVFGYPFILIFFAVAVTLQAWWGMCVLIHSQFGFDFPYTSFKRLVFTLKLPDDPVFIHRPLEGGMLL